MTPGNWIALLGVLVGLLGLLVPVMLASNTRKNDIIAKQAETIQTLRDTITDYKIMTGQLNQVGSLVTRTVAGLPIPQPERDGT